MPIEIIVPRLGWTMEEGAFVAWLKNDGDFVRAGEALFSIEGDKAIQEIESIDSGVLCIAANGPKPGGPIRVGDVLGHLVSEAETVFVSPPMAVLPSGSPGLKQGPAPLAPSLALESKPFSRRASQAAISPRALRVAAELGIDWTTIVGSGRAHRIRESDVRAAASASAAQSTSSILISGEQKATVLVIGGCGFIGTWVIRDLLERGLDVVVLDAGGRPPRWKRVIGAASEQIRLIQGSLLNRDLLARIFNEHQVTHVIHLAALLTPACQTDPWEGCRVNVLGGVALFEQIRKSSTPIQGFSYASSVAVFGLPLDHTEGALDSENGPVTFYGVFKKSLELIAEQYWRQYRIASLGIRPQVVFGPERTEGLTAGPSLAARAAALGETFNISYTGQVGYDYVEDVARAFVRGALEPGPGAQVVDLNGEVADIAQVIAAIEAAVPGAKQKLSASGPRIPTHTPPSPHFIADLYPDWKTTSLNEGILRTVEFYKNLTALAT